MKYIAFVIGVMCITAFAVHAQTPDLTPSQFAIKLNTAINGMAERMDAQNLRIDLLAQAVAKSQARVKELEDKYEKKPAEEPKP